MKKILFTLLLAVISAAANAVPNYQYSLQDTDGKTVTQADFPNQYQIIAFGYTHCPDVCPTTLYDFKQVMAKIANPEQFQPIFITIDPTRDSADSLKKYIGYFDQRIIGLRGSRSDIDTVTANFNASYGYQIDGKKTDVDTLPADTAYDVYHSTLIYLLNPKGELIDVFDYQSGAANLQKGIEDAVKDDRL